MKLAESRLALRRDLGDIDQSNKRWSDEQLDGGLERAVDDLNRILPDEAVADLRLTMDIEDESVTVNHGVWVSLANTRIQPYSETVTNAAGTTEYVRDTDYEMDYSGGRIKALAAGSMTDDVAHLIDYRKQDWVLDLNSLTGLIRVLRTEYFREGLQPIECQGQLIDRRWFHLTAIGTESRQTLTEDAHFWVYYVTAHTAPTATATGSYPAHLDEVMLKGARAYALLMKAWEVRFGAIDSVDDGDTSLSSIAAALTDLDTALDKMSTYNGSAATALAKIQSYIDDMETDLALVATYLTNGGTDLISARVAAASANTSTANVDSILATAQARLAEITAFLTDAISRLATAQNILDQANTDLDAVPALITSATSPLGANSTDRSSAQTALADVLALRNLAAAYVANADDHLAVVNTDILDGEQVFEIDMEAEIDSAETLLATPITDALINKVNLGVAVPENYRQLGEARALLAQLYSVKGNAFFDKGRIRLLHIEQQMSQTQRLIELLQGRIAEAAQYVAIIGSRIAEGNAYGELANTRVNQAQVRASEANTIIQEALAREGAAGQKRDQAQGYIEVARVYVEAANANNDESNDYIDIADIWARLAAVAVDAAQVRVSAADRLAQEAAQYIAIAQSFAVEASQRADIAQIYLQKTDRHVGLSTERRELADKFEVGGQTQLAEFRALLNDRAQLTPNIITLPSRQQAPAASTARQPL